MEWPVEFFMALRYLRPQRSFVSVITILSFLGVTLGVMALIVVLSVMTGFGQELAKRIIGFNAPIKVTMADGSVLYDYDQDIALIQKVPGVTAAGAYVQGPVLARHNGIISPAYIKSVPETGDDPVLPLKQYLKLGDYELEGDSVLVGLEWAKRNGAFPGDKIDIYGPAMLDAISQQTPGKPVTLPLPEEPIIRGIFETGQFDYDLNFLLVSTEMAQHLYGMEDTGRGGSVHGIAVQIKDPTQADAVRDAINRALPSTLRAHTWLDDNRDFFNAIEVERVTMAFILYLVMIVASFGVCSTLITITVQKSREIGLMKALGATDRQVCGVFLLHGFVVGVVGALSGTILGLVLLHYRNPFRVFLLRQFHIRVFPNSVYGTSDIPAVIDPFVVTAIAVSAVAICVLAALVPALSAAKLAPARALRYE
ncbi:MAG TPA: ABC transporter permease [Candidatus Methylacidiphilales bacterium]|nr:ABC transporter permease [Candidatus Methylacidiphilales bacterium]